MPFKRTILTIVLIQFLATLGVSQSIKQDTFSKSFGVDANFVNRFLPFENSIGVIGNYLFHHITYREKGDFIRQAFDLSLSGNFDKREFEVDRNNTRFSFDYKIGRGKRKNLFKNGNILYGAEFQFGYFINRQKIVDQDDLNGDSFNINKDQNYNFELGPFVGFEYKINNRISLYTEAGVYARLAYSIDNFESDLNPEFDFEDTNLFVTNNYDFPASLILFYNFN